MPCAIGLSDAWQSRECPAPSRVGILKVADRFARPFEEQVIVPDLPRTHERVAQDELPVHDLQRPWTELDTTVLTRFRRCRPRHHRIRSPTTGRARDAFRLP